MLGGEYHYKSSYNAPPAHNLRGLQQNIIHPVPGLHHTQQMQFNGHAKNRPSSNSGTKDLIIDEFEVNHLSSFVSNGQSMLSPDEAVVRLKKMDTSSGIWTIRCLLRVLPNRLIVKLKNNGETMEDFPLDKIREVTYRMTGDSTDKQNNLVLFSSAVEEEAAGRRPAELHIFQSLQRPANTIADVIRQTQERLNSTAVEERRPRAPGSADMNDGSNFGTFPLANLQTGNHQRLSRSQEPAFASFVNQSRRDNTDEPSKHDRVRRAHQLLNYCFDDIDRFVARLHQAAEAIRELERRQNQRKRKEKKHGDGLLTMRTRLPPLEEFVDCFKKFKLSFNLLSRLQGEIHDPNATELAHLLIQPLSLLVDASRDPETNVAYLPARVVSPLLTSRTIVFLSHCLTSKEEQVWRGLGQAWTTPKEEWVGYVPPFHPKFSDYFTPDPEDLEDDPLPRHLHRNPDEPTVVHLAQITAAKRSPSQLSRSVAPVQLNPPVPVVTSHVTRSQSDNRGHAVTHHPHHANRESRQSAFCREVIARGGVLYEAISDKSAKNSKELSILKGDILELLDDSRNWWRLRNMDGEEGHCPFTLLTPLESAEYPGNEASAAMQLNKSAQLSQSHSASMMVNVQSHVPKSQGGLVDIDRRIPLPTPEEQEDMLVDELKSKLCAMPATRVIKRPKCFNINSESTADQVAEWLSLKGFNERVVRCFERKTGHDLFKLSRMQLELLIGREDSIRLESLLTVQKNIAGYKTMSGRELEKILQRRKEQADGEAVEHLINELGGPPETLHPDRYVAPADDYSAKDLILNDYQSFI